MIAQVGRQAQSWGGFTVDLELQQRFPSGPAFGRGRLPGSLANRGRPAKVSIH
jgi:hypothetical protein